MLMEHKILYQIDSSQKMPVTILKYVLIPIQLHCTFTAKNITYVGVLISTP